MLGENKQHGKQPIVTRVLTKTNSANASKETNHLLFNWKYRKEKKRKREKEIKISRNKNKLRK